MVYPWLGNIRELKNSVEYACVECRGEFRLKNTYDLKHNRCVRDTDRLSEKLRFTGSRIARMINDLNGSLQS